MDGPGAAVQGMPVGRAARGAPLIDATAGAGARKAPLSNLTIP